MRAYFQLFFSLLIPLSALAIVVVTIYYNNQYVFNKAFRIGVLFGSITGVAVSLFTALFILIMRLGKQPQSKHSQKSFLQKDVFPKKKPRTPVSTAQSTETLTHEQSIAESPRAISKPENTPRSHSAIEQKLMLLMDKELAFEVILHAIFDQKIGTLTENKSAGEHLTVKNSDGLLQLSVIPLTRHTSQLAVTSAVNSPSARQVIQYIKEKEHSFLQY